jgi:hypothetical protein
MAVFQFFLGLPFKRIVFINSNPSFLTSGLKPNLHRSRQAGRFSDPAVSSDFPTLIGETINNKH